MAATTFYLMGKIVEDDVDVGVFLFRDIYSPSFYKIND